MQQVGGRGEGGRKFGCSRFLGGSGRQVGAGQTADYQRETAGGVCRGVSQIEFAFAVRDSTAKYLHRAAGAGGPGNVNGTESGALNDRGRQVAVTSIRQIDSQSIVLKDPIAPYGVAVGRGCIHSDPIPTVEGDQVIVPHCGILGIGGNMDAILNVAETNCSPGIGADEIAGHHIVDGSQTADFNPGAIVSRNEISIGDVTPPEGVPLCS